MDKGMLELFATQIGNTGRVEPISRRYGKRAIKRIIISRRERRDFKNAYGTFYRLSEEGKSISHGMLWITENFTWLCNEVERSINEIKLLSWRLPVVTEGDMRGLPSIYTAATEFIYKTRANCSSDDFITFFSAYSQTHSLTLKELWAIETMIRLVLLRQIITVAVRLSKIAENETGGMRTELDDERFSIETGCACSVRAAVMLLKSLGDISWDELFYKVNPVHEILTEEKSGVYSASDDKTKKYWWELISKKACNRGASERGYARRLVLKANDAYENGGGKVNGSVGFYLEKNNSHSKAVFVTSLFACYTLIIVITAMLLHVRRAPVWEYLAVFTTISVLAITISLKWAQWVSVRLFGSEKRVLPCLDASEADKSSVDTVVTVAALITSGEYARKMISRLEEHYLLNRDDFLSFALLCDLKESQKEVDAADSEILDTIKEGVEHLNRKYSPSNPKFYAFVRKRVWNDKTRSYTAYERKRGAVLSFTQKLCGNGSGEFCGVFPEKEGEMLSATYCIVLDADTRIRPQGARELVFSAAHPLNTPVINEENKVVERGYTIITAPIGVNGFSVSKSKIGRVLSGGGGEGAYALSPFDIWWDIFGEGSFCGKGIINCRAFSQLMLNRFEDGVILSHDLIEGGYCSTGVTRSVDLTDDFPRTWLSYRKREHRWIRGDWQLIGFLGKYVKCKGSKRVRNTLGIVTKVKILLNLVRSLIYPKLLKGLVLGLLYPFLAKWVFVWFFLKNILPIGILIIKNSFYAVFKGKVNIIRWEHLALPLVRFTLIADTAAYSFNAMCKALIRLFTRKKLLEWETAQQAEDRGFVKSVYKTMLPSVITGVIMICGAIALGGGVIPLFSGAVFLVAPFVGEKLSREDKGMSPDEKEKKLLLSWCRDGWRFFEDTCNDKTSWLPPDNVQVYPKCPPCTKTSPTNIGMYLISLVTAHNLNFTDTDEFIKRASKALESLRKMEKYMGHTYNWYDICTLKPIAPFFISTADNGNLAASLIVLSQKATNIVNECGEYHRDELLSISRLSRGLAEKMDFSLLYSYEKKLFAIGYDVQRGAITEGVYDLVASEARLASIFAIAFHQIEYKHWARLARRLVLTDKGAVLMSWSGTMFEYLMPELFIESPMGSLMNRAQKNMLKLQIKYGKENQSNVWGISESGYYAFDRDKRYQYKAFGVKYSAIDKQRTRRYVVSPYSSALALMVDVKAAIKNIAVLKNEIAQRRVSGEYKYFLEEAIDYFDGESAPSVVEMYMAHHTGMSVCAMGNVLCDKNVSALFMSCPEISALSPFITEPLEGEVRISTAEQFADVPKRKGADNSRTIDGILQTRCSSLLTNGRLKAMYTTDGGGYLMLNDELAIAYNGILPRETQGSFIYIRNERDKSYFSPSPAPCYSRGYSYKAYIKGGEVEYVASSDDITARERICISPEDNVEIREITLKRSLQGDGDYSVTGYVVPSLSRYGDWCAHRVFNEIFMSVEYDETNSLFIVKKKAKRAGEHPRYLMYMLVCDDNGEVTYSSNREDFIGRGRDASCPKGMEGLLLGNPPTVIYPCAVIRKRVNACEEGVNLYFVTGMFYSLDELYNAVQIYKSTHTCRDTFNLSALREKITCDCLGVSAIGLKCAEMIASRVFFLAERNFCKGNIDAFYKLGLSGNNPVILCEITGAMGYGYFLKTVLEVFAYLRLKGLPVELIISVTSVDDYRDELLRSVRERAEKFNSVGAVTVINGRDISKDDLAFIRCVARASLRDGAGSLYECLKASFTQWGKRVRLENNRRLIQKPSLLQLSAKAPLFKTEYGYFTKNGEEYHVTVSGDTLAPLAWSNVLGDKSSFGTVVTERAGGFVWCGTAQNRITRWYNDPVEDPPTEIVYIKNNDTGEFFTPQNIGCPLKNYVVMMRDNAVKTVSSTEQYEASSSVYVRDNIKFTETVIKNRGKRSLSLTLYYYADIFLPINNHTMFHQDMFARGDVGLPLLEVTSAYGDTSVVMSCDKGVVGWISKKDEFFGRGYTYDTPLAVVKGIYHTEYDTKTADCGVIVTHITVPQESEARVRFTLTALEITDKNDKYQIFRDFIQRARRGLYEGEINDACIKIETPCKELDIFFNNKLMKQIYGIRYMARTSYYQCSGAYGFRDQLQDMLAIMYKDTDVARRHILLCSARQFEEGDVLHWFNEDYRLCDTPLTQRLPLSGVRTRISDDKLFLPFVALKYALFTGDKAIFDEVTPFLKAKMLDENEESRFMSSFEYGEASSLYNHCIRAFENAYVTGAHGLLLMGSGDWNDAMDAIGEGGLGESVWLSMFYVYVARCFLRLFGGEKEAQKIALNAESLSKAISENAWDGKWFIRAFYGDKTPVGSHMQMECKIDLLAQAWAVIAKVGNDKMQRQGMESAWEHLFDSENKILKLFTPPYENTPHHPGYIKGYIPGTRENGGQYTHGAIWYAIACLLSGESNKGWEILKMCNPVERTKTSAGVEKYKTEPYWLAADIYSAQGCEGRGGWSGYTGSASWYFIAVVEYLMGIKIEDGKMKISPSLPREWGGYSVCIKYFCAEYHITVKRSEHKSMYVDGLEYSYNNTQWVPLYKDGEHIIECFYNDSL